MFGILDNMNQKMLPMKMHYYFYSGCIVLILGYGSTYAKQLGYSKITVAYITTCLFFVSMMTKPIIGALVDKFPIKKYIFLGFIFLTGISSFFLMFVPKLTVETGSELYCNTSKTIVKIYSNDSKRLSFCDKKRLSDKHGDRLVNCKLNCNNNDDLLFSEMINSWNAVKSNAQNVTNIMSDTNNISDAEIKNVDLKVYLHFHDFNPGQMGSYDFYVMFAELNNYTRLTSPYCQRSMRIPCQLHCSNQAIMELATVTKPQEAILVLPEFWEYFLLLCLFWISYSSIWTIQDSICFDLLEDNSNDFGKLRCWTSIGWGSVSIFSGWLVDFFSADEVYKNYTPIAYLVLSFTIMNLIFTSDIKVTELDKKTVEEKSYRDILVLFTKLRVIFFFTWITMLGVYCSITMNYLYIYLDEMASVTGCDRQKWTKTIQGLSQGLQCFGGEMPVFFCSGWIIKKIGHRNCMSTVLFAFIIRFFIYSVMTNPFFAMVVEILNGATYALGRAVVVSYSRTISPPGTHNTVLGLVGLFDCIGLSLGNVLAAHIYEFYGGVLLFRLFTYGSAVMCALHVVYTWFDSDKVKL